MNETPKIGIWGPTGSGKTTYLGALYLELQKEWTIVDQTSRGRHSTQLTIDISNALGSGDFPPATPRESKHYVLFFHPNSDHSLRRLRQRKFELSLIEAPGEFTGRDPGLREEDEVRSYYEHLSECDGLILMIDPESNNKRGEDLFGVDAGTYFLALQKLFSYLKSDVSGKVLPKLAFCLTKIDADLASERISQIGLESTIFEIIGEDAKNLIRSRCSIPLLGKPRVKYFGISSVGTYTIEGHKRPNIHYSPRENKHQIAKPFERKSINVTAPLDWLRE